MSLDTLAGLPHTEQLPRRRNRVFRALRRPVRWLMTSYWNIRIHGREQLPPRGPMILVANHVGVIDGPLMVVMHPQPAFALAKVELFTGALGKALDYIGQISIDRRRADLRGVTRAIHLLRSGGVLTVFPEGKRTGGEVAYAQRGAAYLAMVTGAPVIPVALFGTRGAGRSTAHIPGYRTPIHICYGRPMRIPAVPWPRTKLAVAEWTERIRTTLAEHIAQSRDLTGMELPGPPGERRPVQPRRAELPSSTDGPQPAPAASDR
ncbi:MAG: 1-acyl-sn-glycerol-3-phosphate acyltransferase [Microlunatus sp.]|nr:1-acyl-sn-glycerol-3-phosphate acyltransferase [Microlunatus sp.]